VCLWKLGEWRDVEWIMAGASNMELIRMLYGCAPVIYLLITGKIYLATDNRTHLIVEMTFTEEM
jgi:hypothetical protein